VQPDATQAQIKKAYFKKSLLCHPDKNPDNPDAIKQFQRLTHIREILCDPAKRAHYDRFGEESLDELDSGSEPEAEEDFDATGDDEFTKSELQDLFNKIRNKGNSTVAESIVEDIMLEQAYKPRKGRMWQEDIVEDEWNKAKKAAVKRLLWSERDISALPEGLISSGKFAKELRVVNLHRNQLDTLPDSFAQLKSLQELIISANKFENFPEVITKLTKLKIINAEQNRLSALPESFSKLTALEDLNLSTNKFEEFPETILSLSKLKTLNMERNSLNGLPKSFCKLKQLTSASFFGNQMKNLDDDCFKDMTNLRKVDLQCNFLQSLPQSITDLLSHTENFILSTDDMTQQPKPKRKAPKRKAREATKKPKNPPAKRQRRK